MNAQAILQRFDQETPEEDEGQGNPPSALLPSDWRQLDRLVKSAVKDTHAAVSKVEAITSPSLC